VKERRKGRWCDEIEELRLKMCVKERRKGRWCDEIEELRLKMCERKKEGVMRQR